MPLKCGRVWIIALALALFVAPGIALAGGPPSADRVPAQDRGLQTPQSTPPPAPSAASPAQGFGISGGVGFASIAGGIGTSPQLNLAYTGERRFAWYTRIYSPWLGFDRSMNVRASGELLWFEFKKGPETYTGVNYTSGHFTLAQGNQIDSKLDAHFWRLNGDVAFTPLKLAGAGIFRLGPRFQGFIYSDLFRIQNVTNHQETEELRRYFMPGIGLFASLDLGNLVPGAAGSFRPRLNIAGTLGKGNGMRYKSWEVFAEILVGPGQMGGLSSIPMPLPGVLLQAGYIGIKIIETKESEAMTDAGMRSDRAHYEVNYPLVRASVSF